VTDDGSLIVVRPLVYCAEEDIRAFAELEAFPILPCDLCGSQEHLQRKAVGRMLDQIERERPGSKTIMLAALRNVHPSHLLDRRLWAALHLPAERDTEEEGSPRDGIIPNECLVRT